MKTKLLFATLFAIFLFNISNLFSQTIIKTSFYSQALEENKNVNVFLPSCYNSDTSSYPVIYYLHGWYGNENSAQLVMQLADTYINNGTIEPVIIVCANNLSQPFLGSFYKNSDLNGNYENYMTQDLIQWVESNYRVKSGKNNRSLMGQSMGGYGSFRLAVLHKNLYRGIAAHGSALNFDLVIDDIKQEIENENGPGPDYFYNFATTGLFTKMIFAMSGAFSPNSETSQDYINPAIVEFPFDEKANVIDSVYQKFSSNDPVSFINTLLPSDSIAILFGAGRNDELHLFQSNYSFRDTLDYYGLDYEYVDHYGTHNMPTIFRQRGLIFLDSVMNIVSEVEYCETPSDLCAVSNSDSSAQLSWTENGSADSWQVRLVVSGTDTSNVTPISVNSIPYIISGLSANTSYDWNVRSNCGDGNFSDWSCVNTFSTSSPITLPYIEDWETESGYRNTNGSICSGNSSNWTFETNRQNEGRVRWGTNTHQANTGNGALTMDRNPSAQGIFSINYAILTLNLSNYTESSNLALSFWWVDHEDETQTNDKVWIRGSVSDPWVLLYDLNPKSAIDDSYHFVSELDIDSALAGAYQKVSSSFQIRLGQEDDYNTDWDGISFDDIVVEELQICSSCIEPSSLSVSNLSSTSVKLNWIENCDALGWEIAFGTSGFDTTNSINVFTTENPFTWDNLLPNTEYEWYVRSVCANNQYSSWAGPHSFTTLISATLPFYEDWEVVNGSLSSDGEIYSGNSYVWNFNTDHQNEGRARWGTNTHQPNTGLGALTLDRNPSQAGNYAVNYTTLTLDLSNYTESTELFLSFWWADHGDETHTNDKVWIRGSYSDSWVMLYELDPKSTTDDHYQLVSDLDIDAALDAVSQTVSSSFQLRFGQQDDYNTDWDGISFDDIVIEDKQIELNPITLPFVEDWESACGEINLNKTLFSSDDYIWAFETDNQTEGRVRWGTNAHQTNTGLGAMTMDRNPSQGGDYAVNYTTLTLDLSNYTESSDLLLSFWWADHGDETQTNDKVWIRGSDSDPWVIFYSLDPKNKLDDSYQLVADLDIDDALSGASQSVTSTFQLRFGQEDDYNTDWDGISFDDIVIEEKISEPKKSEDIDSINNRLVAVNNNIQVYSYNNYIYLKSTDQLIEKEVFIYDLYGRVTNYEKVSPSELIKIPVDHCNCYKVVKVLSENKVSTFKVFVK